MTPKVQRLRAGLSNPERVAVRSPGRADPGFPDYHGWAGLSLHQPLHQVSPMFGRQPQPEKLGVQQEALGGTEKPIRRRPSHSSPQNLSNHLVVPRRLPCFFFHATLWLSRQIHSFSITYSFPLEVPLGREETSQNCALRVKLQSIASKSEHMNSRPCVLCHTQSPRKAVRPPVATTELCLSSPAARGPTGRNEHSWACLCLREVPHGLVNQSRGCVRDSIAP